MHSQLSLDGHPYKTDTSVRRAPGLNPRRLSVILLLYIVSIRRTPL